MKTERTIAVDKYSYLFDLKKHLELIQGEVTKKINGKG